MTRVADASLATLALTSRLVPGSASPLRASEYWDLAERCDLASLHHADDAELAARFGTEFAARIVALLDRSSALAFALEELEQQGIATIAANDDRYPERWLTWLRASAPPLIHVAGSVDRLQRGGLAIVGSRDLAETAVAVAQRAALAATERAMTVVSGGARGTDSIAMTAALDAGGESVGVLADALVRAARSAETRRAILDDRLTLVTPYAPAAPFSTGNAMGRNKLIYALADVTFVVASDLDQGGTWAGAVEAVGKRYGRVAVWIGDGAGPGNAALVERGATPVRDVAELFDLPTGSPPPAPPTQLGLDLE